MEGVMIKLKKGDNVKVYTDSIVAPCKIWCCCKGKQEYRSGEIFIGFRESCRPQEY